jgi:hypothetical protein
MVDARQPTLASQPVDARDPDQSLAEELYPYVLPDETITDRIPAAMDYVSGQQEQAKPQETTRVADVFRHATVDSVWPQCEGGGIYQPSGFGWWSRCGHKNGNA